MVEQKTPLGKALEAVEKEKSNIIHVNFGRPCNCPTCCPYPLPVQVSGEIKREDGTVFIEKKFLIELLVKNRYYALAASLERNLY